MKRNTRMVRRHRARFSPQLSRGAIIGICVFAAVLLLLLIFRPREQLLNSPEVEVIQNRGVLHVGVLENSPGFSAGGQGLEVALAERLAYSIFPEADLKSDILIEFIPVTQQTVRPKLNVGEIDIAFAKVHNDGSDSYQYSGAYYTDPCILVVAKANKQADFSQQAIGVIQGTASQTRLSAYQKSTKAAFETVLYASYPDMIQAVRDGDVFAAAMPRTEALAHIANDESLTLHAHAKIGSIDYVAVSQSENGSLAILADMMIEQMQKDGSLQTLIEQNGLS